MITYLTPSLKPREVEILGITRAFPQRLAALELAEFIFYFLIFSSLNLVLIQT